MEHDYGGAGWGRKASCRWVAYFTLWSLTVSVCAVSALHVVLVVVGAMLGFMLAASLPLMFATLFEVAYSRRARSDMAALGCPWIGSAIVVVGVFLLLHCSALIVSEASATYFDTARELCGHLVAVPTKRLPHSVCIRHAFVKTDWEASKLECESEAGHVACEPAFVAAPVFNSKALSDVGQPDEIWAWAVTHGGHVNVNYRFDGTYCAYLAGLPDLDFYIGDFRLAVQRVIDKYQLQLGGRVEQAPGAEIGETASPLEGRPVLLSVDPMAMQFQLQTFLVAVFILLFCSPCVGPVPLGCIFVFWSWAGGDRYRAVAPDEYYDDSRGFY